MMKNNIFNYINKKPTIKVGFLLFNSYITIFND